MLFPTLTIAEYNLASALAWVSGINIFDHIVFSDGVFDILRSALTKGGIIFTDSQPLQDLLDVDAFKYRVISISRILHVRSKGSPQGDILSKISTVLDPSTCVLALGT